MKRALVSATARGGSNHDVGWPPLLPRGIGGGVPPAAPFGWARPTRSLLVPCRRAELGRARGCGSGGGPHAASALKLATVALLARAALEGISYCAPCPRDAAVAPLPAVAMTFTSALGAYSASALLAADGMQASKGRPRPPAAERPRCHAGWPAHPPTWEGCRGAYRGRT